MTVMFGKQNRSEADPRIQEAEGGLGYRKDRYGHKFSHRYSAVREGRAWLVPTLVLQVNIERAYMWIAVKFTDRSREHKTFADSSLFFKPRGFSQKPS